MPDEIVGIFHSPWQGSYDQHKSLAQLYRRAVWLKANPRDEQYMHALFRERYPNGKFVATSRDPNWAKQLSSADTVVLLYPDSIGLGYGALEALVENSKKTWATVRVLNGRRRDFVVSRRAKRALRWRRLIERAMLGEVVAMAGFLLITPFLVLTDFVKGRR
jgi:hypothetical protein